MRSVFKISFLLILLTSCESVSSYKLPVVKEEIVLESFIHKGDTIRVLAGFSSNALPDYEFYPEGDFEILLMANDLVVDTMEFVSLQFANNNNNAYNFSSDIIAAEQVKYTVQAHYSDFSTAIGEDVVPTDIFIKNFKVNTENSRITFDIEDDPGLANYYRVELKITNTDTQLDHIVYDPDFEILYGRNDFIPGENSRSGLASLLPDRSFNGSRKTFIMDYANSGEPLITDSITFIITHISKDYYEYERSKAAQFNLDVLLFSEPTNIYSNIINGYGSIVCGNSSHITFKP